MINSFPFLGFKGFYHVGTLNPKDKKVDSFEGNGLSVSVDPEVWKKITPLEGSTWKLSKPNGGKFMFATSLSPENYHEIWNWGLENGYTELKTLFNVRYFQEGLDEMVTLEFDTKEEFLEKGIPEERIVKNDHAIKNTKKFEERLGWSLNWTPFIFDIVITFYAEDNGFDGVWWNHLHNVEKRSAPCGVIFKSKLEVRGSKKTNLFAL